MNDFADELKHWRRLRSLTHQELADLSGISANSISELERRVTLRPRPSTAKLLAENLSLAGEDHLRFMALARDGSVSPEGTTPRELLEAETGPAPAAGDRVVPRMLRRDIESFTGRADELAQLVAAASRAPSTEGVVGVYVIEGMGGVGKTTLALRAAHTMAAHFPDGQLFLDLHGYTPGVRAMSPDRALRSLLHALGVREERIPRSLADRGSLYRSLLADTRTLVVLDNAANPAQIEPLLPGTAGCPVIITSRRGLGALEDARTIRLETPPEQEAIRLFCAIAGHAKAAPEDDTVARIVALCGYLPLAMRIMAAQLAHERNLSSADVLARLTQEHRRLARLADQRQNVTVAFELSFRNLPADAQRMFASLGLIAGPDFEVYAAASLVGDPDICRVRSCLETLIDHNLLIDDPHGRFRFHDLVRDFAQLKAAAADQEGLDRLLDFYLCCSQAADGRLERRLPSVAPRRYAKAPQAAPELTTPGLAQSWLAAESRNLEEATRAAFKGGRLRRALALSVALSLAEYLRANGPWAVAAELHRLALKAATAQDDRVGQSASLVNIGVIERQTGGVADAARTLTQAAASCPADAKLTLGGALVELGTARRLIGEAREAGHELEGALSLYRAAGSVLGEAAALREIGAVHFQLGRFADAEGALNQALVLYRRLGTRFGEAGTLAYLGGVRLAVGEYAGADEVTREALRIYEDLDDPICQANCLLYLGKGHLDTGLLADATTELAESLRLYQQLGDRRGVAGALAFLGAAQLRSDELQLADESLREAALLFGELSDPGGEAEATNLHAALAFASGERHTARDRYTRALRIACKISSDKDKADALGGIAECNRSEGRSAAAERNYRRALTLYEAMKCDSDAARVSAALAAIEAEQSP
jgi:tetratricopeptide (TPR) repeat protein/transcriptional regulator with XRE-family HTH domain